jgi:DNA-directed RNA polymerase subunit RPC12/RpoP
MPIVVACRCGQRFAAKDHLFGRQVPCPACGSALTVADDASAPAEEIYVSCACGRAFFAPESMRGELTRCRGCGRKIQVPGPDPLGLGSNRLAPRAAIAQRSASLTSLPPATVDESEIPWATLKRMGIVGGSVLLLVIVVTTVINHWRHPPRLPKAERIAALVAAVPRLIPTVSDDDAASHLPNSNSAGAEGENPARGSQSLDELLSNRAAPVSAADDSAIPFEAVTPRAIVVPAASSSNERPAVARLPEGVQDWYAQPGGRLSGIRRVNATDPPIAHFSWLTGLLPFLGHGQLYQQFDFQKPLTQGKNLQLGGVLIPEFLNPLDDRQRWKGYPFDGIALTHFVGMSGVEDARNVVAAKLPRSDPRAGVFGYDEIARPEEITDGQSQTIMIAGAGAMANPWMFGGGATIRGAREPLFDGISGLGTRGMSGGGSVVVMADGSVRQFSANTDPRVFRALCTIHGSESVNVERAAPPFSIHDLKKQ